MSHQVKEMSPEAFVEFFATAELSLSEDQLETLLSAYATLLKTMATLRRRDRPPDVPMSLLFQPPLQKTENEC